MQLTEYDDIILAEAPIVADASLSRSERERAAVAAIVARLFGPDARLAHRDSGAPYLVGREDISLSVSHSRDRAVVACSARRRVGVDVESWRQQLVSVAPRVLSERELAVYAASPQLLLRAWTMKEALYKAALTPGLDFRADIHLPLDPDAATATVRDSVYEIVAVSFTPDHTITLVAQ